MKISVSLPDGDVEALDAYAREAGLESRSAAVHRAIQCLRHAALEADYSAAFAEWDSSEDHALWDQTAQDGVSDAPR